MKRASLAKSWRGNMCRPKKDLRHFLPINWLDLYIINAVVYFASAGAPGYDPPLFLPLALIQAFFCAWHMAYSVFDFILFCKIMQKYTFLTLCRSMLFKFEILLK